MDYTAIPCTCCTRPLSFPEDVSILECPACGTRNARPRATGPSLELLRRAITQRLSCDFNAAERSYQQVLLYEPDEHEALWGRLLCHYGVEYVSNPTTGRLTPTVHTVRSKPLREQRDFIDACDFAPPQIREQYERDAAYIDQAQLAIRTFAASCPPYDVFLCHKSTKPGSGEKTEDFYRASQLYHHLREKGVRAFFAPESLQSVAGADYEAGIYHALCTARVMLVLCSEAEYLTSAWVRSEWSRYLEMVDEGQEKRLVPLLYDHLSAHSLPAEFRYRKLQGLKMGELTSTDTLWTLLKEELSIAEPEAPEEIAEAVPAAAEAKEPAPAPALVRKPVRFVREPFPILVKDDGRMAWCSAYSKLSADGMPAAAKVCRKARDVVDILYGGYFHLILKTKDGKILSTLSKVFTNGELDPLAECVSVSAWENMSTTNGWFAVAGVRPDGSVHIASTVRDWEHAARNWPPVRKVAFTMGGLIGLTLDGCLVFSSLALAGQFTGLIAVGDGLFGGGIADFSVQRRPGQAAGISLATLQQDGTVHLYNVPDALARSAAALHGIRQLRFGGVKMRGLLKPAAMFLYALNGDSQLYRVSEEGCSVIMSDCADFTTGMVTVKEGSLIALDHDGRFRCPDPLFKIGATNLDMIKVVDWRLDPPST